MSNTQYHVAAGLAGIYAGIIKPNGHEWSRKSDVTDEAINAVRDHMFDEAMGMNQDTLTYYWPRKDGRTVSLSLHISSAPEPSETA